MAVILYLRMLGYAVTIIMHLSNCVCLGEAMKGPASEDPDIKAFGALQLRFFTTWTFLWYGKLCSNLEVCHDRTLKTSLC
ncbi:hypothetical protein MSG28_015050 [Choristoneura fumiferana]|uniref:Uncharacterized protein n=1 Tax=Choristoneura fumiferana TaxID=7141 RepID=A0ACC0KYS3_CHOFU|nr:hypothetical protein MSG28_015050 [Choristoneura fumiferana]